MLTHAETQMSAWCESKFWALLKHQKTDGEGITFATGRKPTLNAWNI